MSGCETAQVPPPVSEACAGWDLIYPAKSDTRETKEQILNNNCAWHMVKGLPAPAGCTKEKQ